MKSNTINERIVLTISLLSSGRKNTIWKCLDSLLPIMDVVPSELIIVDTGCDEETHTRMREYTEKIIKFEWCNDFSKARNIGLKEAKGEWFLYIDDDEWFTDVTEIIDFFQSGEYKQYGHATYLQRNYLDKQGVHYKDSWVSRMAKIEKDTSFVSSIHEYISPVRGKAKLLHCAVEHYGYLFTNSKEKYEHSKRNTVLLLDMLQKEPKNLRWWTHLLQEYRGISEWTKLHETSLKGLELIKENNKPYYSRARATFYMGVLLSEMARRNHKDALSFALEAVEDKRNSQICNARIYAIISEIYYNMENYGECEQYCKKYLEVRDLCKDDEMKMVKEGTFFIYDAFDSNIVNYIYSFYIGSTLKQNNYEVLRKCIFEINWEEKALFLYHTLVPDVVEGLSKVDVTSEYIEIAKKLFIRKETREQAMNKILEIEEKDKEGFQHLTAIFSQVDDSYYYVWYLKIRDIAFGNREYFSELEVYYKELFRRVRNVLQLKDEVYEIAKQYDIDIEKIFREIPFEQWKQGVDYLCENSNYEKILQRKELIEQLCKTDDIRWNYFQMKFSELEICKLTNKTKYEVISEKLKGFTERQLEFFHRYYKDIAFEGEMEILPSTCRLAVRLQFIFEAKNILPSDMKKCLKECIGVHEAFDPVIMRFIELYKEKIERELEEINRDNQEMERLGKEIEKKVRYFIENNMLKEAAETLKQLKIFLPKDTELEELESQLL